MKRRTSFQIGIHRISLLLTLVQVLSMDRTIRNVRAGNLNTDKLNLKQLPSSGTRRVQQSNAAPKMGGEDKIEIKSEDDFLVYCQNHLLSVDVAHDGIITQDDAADFIGNICDIMGNDDLPSFNCPSPEFHDLSLAVQIVFSWFTCPDAANVDDGFQCLNNNLASGKDFGYPFNAIELGNAWIKVLGFCCSLLPFLEKKDIKPLRSEYPKMDGLHFNMIPYPHEFPLSFAFSRSSYMFRLSNI